jgi:hypothetical protein
MKAYDIASEKAQDLALDIQVEARRDGVVTPAEQRVIELAREVAGWAHVAAVYQRIAQRVAGGGAFDEHLRAQWNEANALVAALRSPVAAQESGGGRKHGIRLVGRAAHGSRLNLTVEAANEPSSANEKAYRHHTTKRSA